MKVLLDAAAAVASDVAGAVRGCDNGDEETLKLARRVLALSTSLEKTCTGLDLPSVLGHLAIAAKTLPFALQKSNCILRAALGKIADGAEGSDADAVEVPEHVAEAAGEKLQQVEIVEKHGSGEDRASRKEEQGSQSTKAPAMKLVSAKVAAPKMTWAKLQKPSPAVNFKDILSEQS